MNLLSTLVLNTCLHCFVAELGVTVVVIVLL